MRKLYASFVLFFSIAICHAQVVTLDPPYPSLTDNVTITYHATQGNGALTGIAPVYMHTGVIVQSVNGWQYVQGNWGTADANVQMTPAGANTWTKTIQPLSFYGLPANTDVIQFAFVFRNANGTIVGRENDDSDIFVNIIEGQPDIQNPPLGIVDGINYLDDETVILQLFAPFKQHVYVIGDFNNWQLSPDYFCKRNAQGNRWWVQIDNLNPGQEYRYQYSIDPEGLRVADVYAEKILDPWHDQWISPSRFPGLISYPHGFTSEIVSVLQTAQQPYLWEVENFNRPALSQMVIYELLVRDFSEKGTFQGVLDSLDYLKRLGINAIELMPVNEFEGNESWGYNPSFYFAVDKWYGPKDDLKKLIDECHKRGIAVILDVVLNHSFGQNPQVRMYSENGAAGPVTAQSPWFNISPTHPFSPGYDYNHDSPHTQAFMKRNMHFWLQEYKVDGFRFDLSKGFTQNNFGGDVNAWSAYDQSRINHWLRIRNEIFEVDNNNPYLILEHFADNSEETVLANAGFLLWGNNHFSFKEASLGYPSNLNGANYQLRGWTFPNLVSYAESHDEERILYDALQFGNSTNPAHDASDINTALARMEATMAFNLLVLGPKMIWQFGELGYDISIFTCGSGTVNTNCKLDNKPVKWDYYFEPARQRLYKVTAALNKLKTDYPALGSSTYNYDVWGFGKRLIIQHSSMNVVVIANFGVQPLSLVPGFPNTGVWYDYFAGTSIVETNLSNPFLLQPGEYRIYTSAPLPTPDISVNTVEVTFHVDMSTQTIDLVNGGVSISGTFNDFAKEAMTAVGNGVYSITKTFVEGEPIEYKFRNGNAFENPQGPCATGTFGNRTLSAPSVDTSLPAVCYASCVACPSAETLFDFTVRVDASQLTNLSPSGIYVAGTFNGFSPEPMTAEGGGVYAYTTPIVEGTTVLWKYTNGPTFVVVENVPSACGVSDGFGGNNRTFVMPSEITVLPTTCFSSCEACPPPACSVDGGTISTTQSTSICVGTGTPKTISVGLTGAVGPNKVWAIVDLSFNVIAVRTANANFNLDPIAPGDYRLYHMSYGNDVNVQGITNGAQLQGCFDLSNFILLRLRDKPSGGTIGTTSPTTICVGDGTPDIVQVNLSGNTGAFSRFGVVSLPSQNIVASQQNGTFNLNSLQPGNYAIYHLSYQDGVSLAGITNASQLQGCYTASNPISITAQSCPGAQLELQPNPASHTSQVVYSAGNDGQVLLSLFDTSGRLVQHIRSFAAIEGEVYSDLVDVSGLPNGIYLYRLQTDREVLTRKLIVAR